MRVAFLGPPGAGKGTQARELAREWGVPHLATGDMLREALAAGTRLGLEARRYMDQGALVPDDVIIGLMGERLAAADAWKGFILDGFPRTIGQAEALANLLAGAGQTLERVIFFDVPEPELLRRLTGRRICRRCQTAYHLVSAPPKRPGVCDKCGGELYQREDDGEKTARNRLEVYAKQTAPLLDHYRAGGRLVTVRAEGPIEAIRYAIHEAVESAR